MLYGGSFLNPVSIYNSQPQFCTLQSYQLFMGLGKCYINNQSHSYRLNFIRQSKCISVDRGISQYKVALEVKEQRMIPSNMLEDWNKQYVEAMEAFAVYCRQDLMYRNMRMRKY